jgi:hypothetical protein
LANTPFSVVVTLVIVSPIYATPHRHISHAFRTSRCAHIPSRSSRNLSTVPASDICSAQCRSIKVLLRMASRPGKHDLEISNFLLRLATYLALFIFRAAVQNESYYRLDLGPPSARSLIPHYASLNTPSGRTAEASNSLCQTAVPC